MIFELIFACFLGVLFGIICGMLPGIHINLVSIILFSLSSYFLNFFSPIILVVFIVAMSITQCFIDFIPSIFLGAPNEDTALSVLPGHRMLLEGNGYGAVKLTTIGGIFGILIALALTPFLIWLAPLGYPYLIKIMPFILLLISVFLVLNEEKTIFALFIFLLSGILGFIVLNSSFIKEPLLPLFTGLFGTSLLFVSIFQKVCIPEQKFSSFNVSKKEISSALSKSIFSSALVSFLPGVGSSQASTISSSFGKISEKGFLILVGAVNVIVMVLSFVALYAIKKPRTGSAVITGKLIEFFSLNHLLICLAVCLFTAGISVFLSLFLAKNFAKWISKANYPLLCATIIFFICFLSLLVSGFASLLVLLVGTSLGILCSELGVRKINLMGCLLIPVILYYLL